MTAQAFFTQAFEWMGAFAAVFMLLYNGQKGSAGGRGAKYIFYVFYPAHVYVLYGLSWLLYVWMR